MTEPRERLGCVGLPQQPVLNALHYKGVVSIWSSEPLFDVSAWIDARTGSSREECLNGDVRRVSAMRWCWSVSSDVELSQTVIGGSSVTGERVVAPVVDLSDQSARILPTPLLLDPIHPNAITEYSELSGRAWIHNLHTIGNFVSWRRRSD